MVSERQNQDQDQDFIGFSVYLAFEHQLLARLLINQSQTRD